MTKEERIQTYSEFYQFYLKEHQNPVSRKLHFFGTALVFVCLFLLVYTGNLWFLLAAPVVGYFFAWVGHFFFEKNKPATFQYPWWSLRSDFKLFFELIVGAQSFNPKN
ncbi:MAG: Mpo1-like protein [Luteibaculaceae bacterium]